MNYNWPLMKDTITKKDRLRMIKFVATTDRFTNGEKVKQFEHEWNSWLGSRHSLFVSSGSTANFLLVAAVKEYFGLKDGDKVLLPACTWMTNVAPIIQLGLTPVFSDINLNNLSFDKNSLAYISKIHPDIKLIFVTHLLGFPSWSNEVFKRYFPDAIVLDDVCESHGVKRGGSKVGADSVGATFSFYFGHHMTTIEGGMVSTNNEELYDLMKMKRSHGLSRESINSYKYAEENPSIDQSFLFVTDGYNFRNNEIAAVLGMSQLQRLDDMIIKRKQNYNQFLKIMSKYHNYFYPTYAGDGDSNFAFPLIARDRDIFNKIKILLHDYGVETRPIVSGNLLEHPFLKDFNLERDKSHPNVSIIQERGLYLGNNHFIGDKEFNILESIMESI